MQVDLATLEGLVNTYTNTPFYTGNYGQQTVQTTGTDYTWIDPFVIETPQAIDPLDNF